MRASLVVLVLLGGCRMATVPYPFERVEAQPRAVHARTIAVLPFVDARQGSDRDGKESVFVYRGIEHDTTRLADMRGEPERALSELLARHLVRAGTFARVVLVDQPKEAPEAELFLTARIRRARGYVESAARDAEAVERRKLDPSQIDDRSVLAEVWLADVTVTARGAPDRPLFVADVGWSIAEERRGEPDAPDPWAVLGDALVVAYGQVASLLAEADLSGAHPVLPEVSLTEAGPTATSSTSSAAPDLAALADRAPPGWRATTHTATSAPPGWRPRTSATPLLCRSTALVAQHTQRFHRVLGPYVPSVEVWWCEGGRLTYDAQVEFPAVYLGRSPRGGHLFVQALGSSNWPGAAAQLTRFFGARLPPGKYHFELEL